MKKLLTLVVLAGAVMCGAAETIGLWTFNGTAGETVAFDTVFPNQINNDKFTLTLMSSGTDAPLATYTDDVQLPHLYGDNAFTNLLGTCTGSLKMDCKAAADTYAKHKAYLKMKGFCAALANKSWTLELIMRAPRPSGWTAFMNIATNASNKTIFTMMGDISVYYSRIDLIDSANNTLSSTSKQLNTYPDSAHGLLDGDWHHFALVWDEDARQLSIYIDYTRKLAPFTLGEGNNLGFCDGVANLFNYTSSGYCLTDAHLQAIRVSEGALASTEMMGTSKYTQQPETVAHFRFTGESGQQFHDCWNEVCPRHDMRYGYNTSYDNLAYANANLKPYIATNGVYIKNESYITNPDPEKRFQGAWISSPRYKMFGESFTYEAIIMPRRNDVSTLASARAHYMGESSFDSAVNAGESGAAWYMRQQNTSVRTDPTAAVTLYYAGVNAENAVSKQSCSFTLSTNTWHHLAMTYDAPTRNFKFYVDYELKKETTFAEGYRFLRGGNLQLPFAGTYANANGLFDGALDEFRITARALPSEEFLKSRFAPGTGIQVR